MNEALVILYGKQSRSRRMGCNEQTRASELRKLSITNHVGIVEKIHSLLVQLLANCSLGTNHVIDHVRNK